MNQKNRDWIIWVGGIALLACWGYGMVARQGHIGVSPSPQALRQERPLLPFNETVTVGTNWYRPNRYGIPAHIWGHPNVNDVAYQARVNFDDARVTDMPPINTPVTNFVELTGDVREIEYRVRPGQAVTQCEFLFQFTAPK